MKPGDVFRPYQHAHATGVWVQDIVGRRRDLTDGQKRLYNQLVRFAGKDGRCFPSQATLAYELGKSERQVRRDLKALADVNLIQWSDGQRANSYGFLWHEWFENPPAEISIRVSDRTSTSGQEGNEADSDRTPVSGQECSDRTDTALCPDIYGRLPGHPRPPNPINPMNPEKTRVRSQDFVKTANALLDYYPHTRKPMDFVADLVRACREAKPDATDEEMAEGIRACYRPSQKGVGLFMSTVPEWLKAGGNDAAYAAIFG